MVKARIQRAVGRTNIVLTSLSFTFIPPLSEKGALKAPLDYMITVKS